jgi:hypothetical protein
VTAPLYRRLARDLTIQLQEISHSYIDQHERLTAKLVDELLRLHMRLDDHEARAAAGLPVAESPMDSLTTGTEMSPEEIYDLMMEAGRSIDVVELCAKRNISLSAFIRLEAKYRGWNPESIRKARMMEATNFELTRLLASMVSERQQPMQDRSTERNFSSVTPAESPVAFPQTFVGAPENGNGRR